MATELGKAYIQIVPSAQGIKGAITKELNGESESAGKSAGLAIAGQLKAAIAAAGIGAAVANTVKKAVEGFADYEQLVGGVETLFKGSADIVQGYAENAFKTAGLSANEYMETVTSFSASLLQSLGGDTEAAAHKADQAITDMSDNANKMGSSMESIQNAYQGFAKQNYTMLDNLKLGYGGTKTEMERLLSDAERLKAAQGEAASYSIDSYADIVDAIHVVQTEMGITGTTALEAAETIEGSISSVKAAADNLISGLANGDANLVGLVDDLVDSAITAAKNVGPAIAQVIASPIELIAQLADPANSVLRILEDMDKAQAALVSANNIYDLTQQYFGLRDQLQDTSLSSSELRDVEARLNTVRQELATATGNAAIAELSLGDALDQQIMKEQTLAEQEQRRSDQELYEKLAAGASDYGELLHEQQTLLNDLADAQKRLSYANDQWWTGSAESAELLRGAVEQLQDDLADGIFDTSTTEGAAEMEARLTSLEQLVTGLTGKEVSFEFPQEAFDYIETLNLDIVDTGDAFLSASEDVAAYEGRLEEVNPAIQAFQQGVFDLVRSGFIPASAGANLLNVSTEQLGRMMLANEQDALAASIANGEFGKQAGTAAASLTEESQAAQETHRAILDIASAAIDAKYSGEDMREAYDSLTKELDKLRDEGDEADVMLAEQQLAMLDLAATSKELSSGLGRIPGALDGISDIGMSLTDLSGWLTDAGVSADDFAGDVASMRDSVVNSFKVLVDESSISAQEMGEALSANLKTMEQWGNDLSDLWAAAVADENTAVQEYISYLSSLGPEYASAVHEFANGGYAELESQAQDWAKMGELSAQYVADGIYMNQSLSQTAAGAMGDAALQAAQEVDFTPAGAKAVTEYATGMADNSNAPDNAAKGVSLGSRIAAGNVSFHPVGYQMDMGIVAGLNSGAGAVRTAAAAVARQALAAAKANLAIASPSKLARDEVGKMVSLGIAKGMVSNDALRALDDAAAELTGKTVEDLKTMVNAWNEVYDNYYEGLEHQNFLLERNNGDPEKIIANYKTAQQALHEQKLHYLRLGVDANDKAIRDMEEQWWKYQDEIDAIYKAQEDAAKKAAEAVQRAAEEAAAAYAEALRDMGSAFGEQSDALEHSLWLAEKNNASMAERLKILNDLQAMAHNQADIYRALGFSEDSPEIRGRQKLWWGYEDEKDKLLGSIQSATQAAEQLYRDFTEDYRKATDTLWNDLTAEYQDGFNKIMSAQQSMQSKLAGTGDLFRSYTSQISGRTYIGLNDLEKQTEAILDYGNTLEGLRGRGIDEDLMQEILGLDMDQGGAFAQRLLNMSDKDWDSYMAAYKAKLEAAASVAEKYYQPDLDELNSSFREKAIDGVVSVYREYAGRVPEIIASTAAAIAEQTGGAVEDIEAALSQSVPEIDKVLNGMLTGATSDLMTGLVSLSETNGDLSKAMEYRGSGAEYADDSAERIASAIVTGLATLLGPDDEPTEPTPINLDGVKIGEILLEPLRRAAKANPEVSVI